MQKLGRYDLIRVLGKGAMGLVYEGRDPNLDRRVAIKTIRVENLSAEEAADYEVRFRTEARSAARLQHPHIVTVFDSDRDGDVAFLVMEFIDGEDLKQHLDRGEVYTLAQTLGIMGDLLSAMDYAHRQGIVHRDIKPANLLMEPSGRLKLTDFGVARIQDSGDATRTQGTMVGTLKYMSPEQVQGRAIDSRSDLFAAGVVLYQLLTSRRPFDGVTDFDVIQNIVSNPPVLPSVITPGLPLELDAVVFRALEKSRDNRYASAQEFHTALVAAVHTGSDQTISPQARPQNKRTAAATLGSGSPPFTAPSESSSGSTSSVVTQEVELVYWKDIKDSSEADDFEEFLRKFPKGIYADLARRKLKRLGTLSNGADTDTGYGATMVIPRAQPAAPAFAGSDEATLVAMPPQSAREAGVAVPDSVQEPKAEAETKTETETETETEAKAEASAAIKPRWSAKVLGFAGAGVLALGGVIYGLGAGSAAPDSTQPITPTPAASQAAVAVSAPASAPASAPIAAVSAASAASAPLPASSVPALPASKPKPAVRASAPQAPAVIPASKPGALKALAPNPVPKDAAESSSTQAPVTPAPSPAKTNSLVDPRTTCEGRWLVSYQICMSMECRKPELAQFPICIERREQERSNLERATKGH